MQHVLQRDRQRERERERERGREEGNFINANTFVGLEISAVLRHT
jgi:hypothetical protein